MQNPTMHIHVDRNCDSRPKLHIRHIRSLAASFFSHASDVSACYALLSLGADVEGLDGAKAVIVCHPYF